MGRGPTKNYYQNMNDFYVEGSLTCLKPEVIRELANSEFPLVLNVEPTNDCNLKCYYCPREKAVQKHGLSYMDMNIYRSIIDQAASCGPLIMLNLHKDGEPLLHPALPEMVRYAKEKKAFHTIHLNTNGLLLASSRARDLLAAGIDDITISIDAARADTFLKFKGINALKKLEEDIQQFYRWRDEMNASTFIRVKIMEFDAISQKEIQEFIQKWQPIADQVQVTGVHSWSGAINNLAVTDEKSQRRYPCGLLWFMLAVNADGQVSVCNVDWDRSGVVGDIYRQSISEIWNGKAMKAVRRNHLHGCWNNPKVCEDCVVWVSVGDMSDFFRERKEFWEKVE